MATPLGSMCLSRYDALENGLGQNPCQVARILIDECARVQQGQDGAVPEYYPLYGLSYGVGYSQDFDHYARPSREQACPCLCSMPVYNLVQGCAACQHSDPYNATSWSYFVRNCQFTPTEYPERVPDNTVIPEWAFIDSSTGSTDIMLAFKAIQADGRSSYKNYTKASETASGVVSVTSTVTETVAGAEPSAAQKSALSETTDAEQAGQDGASPFPTYALAMTIIAAMFAIAFFVTLGIMLQRRKRARRQGTRLRSSSDLVDPDYLAGGGMAQKEGSQVTTGYLPITITGSHLSPRDSRISFTTNSVSTGIDAGPDYRRSMSFAPASTFYTSSRTSASSFVLDQDDMASTGGTEDDDSISPFADIHAPPTAVTSTRDNFHSRRDSYHSSSYLPSGRSRSTFVSSTSAADSASLLSSSTRAPPSSTGATYGRAHDTDEEDLMSLSSRGR